MTFQLMQRLSAKARNEIKKTILANYPPSVERDATAEAFVGGRKTYTVELTEADIRDLVLLRERLPRQIENVQRDGHGNAARYMRDAVALAEDLLAKAHA